MRTYPPKLVKASVLMTLIAAFIVTPSLASTAASVPVASATHVSTLATLHAGTPTAKKEHAKTSAALRALNKTIKANKTMTSKTGAKYLSTADQKILKKARTTAVKKRNKALKGYSSTASISKAKRTTVLLKAADRKLKSSTLQATKRHKARVAAYKAATAAKKKLNSAITSGTKLQDGSLYKHLTSKQKTQLASALKNAKAEKTQAAKQVNRRSAATTKKRTKRYTSATKTLNSTVISLNAAAKKESSKSPQIKNGDKAWKAFVPGLDAGLHYKPNTGWTRESVMVDARNRGAVQMYEAEQIDGKGVITHRFEWNKGKWVEVKEFS